jgi:stearoyl-CoA desaturase (delta-9 desaturase)
MHRFWSHKSFKTSKFKENIMHICALPLLCGSTIVYSGIHRQHHAYSDTVKDPHTTGSIFKTLFYIRDKDFYINQKFIKDLIICPTHKFLHTHYFTINTIILLLFLFVFGVVNTGYFLSTIIVYNFIMIGMVNTVGHMKKYGVRNFETNDNSTNNFWLQLVSWNHGLHNNHHQFPSNYRMNVYPNEFDFPGWMIEKFFLKDELVDK